MRQFSFILCILFVVIGCSNRERADIVGNYEKDKVVVRDTSIKAYEFSILTLKEDGVFELKNHNNERKLAGRWKPVSSFGESEARVAFVFADKRIIGVLKGNIFHFDYPNDFNNGRYESVLYVKLIK